MNAPVKIRASSLAELFDCPARWEARQLLGKRMPMSGAAALGKAVHASTGAFDAARVLGSPITADDAAGAAVDAIHKPSEEVSWDDSTPQVAERVAVALHHRYCSEIAPGIEYEAVEAACDELQITDLGLTLTGTVDRVRRTDAGLGILDIKTGKTAVAADGTVKVQGHGLQLATYELLAEVVTGKRITERAQIVGMQTGLTERGQRVAIGEIDSPRDALLGSGESPGALQFAARLIHSGSFHGNPRSSLCSPKFCPIHSTCVFRK